MNSRIKIVLAGLVVLASTLACVTLMGEPAPQEATSSKQLTFFIPTPTPQEISCVPLTDQMITLASSDSEGDTSSGAHLLDESIFLVTYQIRDDELSAPHFNPGSGDFSDLRNDTDTQHKIWDYFRALIPAAQRMMLSEYVISTDGQGGLLAAVGQTEDDPNRWLLEVDIADSVNYYELTYTLIHEFGHLLTLGPDQVPPSIAVFNNPNDNHVYLKEVSNCITYFPGEGCSNPGSYIDDFYNQFWTDIYEEWNKINYEENDETYYNKLDDFYYKYQDRFVTNYAVTNPEEDIAESWAFFVLGQKPEGNSIAEQKRLFFYQYPELVDLRDTIRENVCLNFPQ